MKLPSVDAVNERRVAKFLDKIDDALASDDLSVFRDLVERYEREQNVPAVEIAAALAKLVQGKTPLLLPKPAAPEKRLRPLRDGRPQRNRTPGPRAARTHAARAACRPTWACETYRIEVGHQHGVQPGNIVGAIANEADLESRFIGRIDIRDDYTLVDLPEGMPHEAAGAPADGARGQPPAAHAARDQRGPGRAEAQAQLRPAAAGGRASRRQARRHAGRLRKHASRGGCMAANRGAPR